jgi:hypothetical protein
MKELIIENITGITAFCAMAVSLLAVLYTRSNIKVQKYIDTITMQRIKWIDTLRNDLSDIISGIYLASYCDQKLSEYDDFMYHVGPDSHEQGVSLSKYGDELNELKSKLKSDISKIELIRKIDLSIMRLNQTDDVKLIDTLEKSKKLVLSADFDLDKIEEFIKELRLEVSIVLKNEWEKVKQEVKKGGIINEKRLRKAFFTH